MIQFPKGHLKEVEGNNATKKEEKIDKTSNTQKEEGERGTPPRRNEETATPHKTRNTTTPNKNGNATPTKAAPPNVRRATHHSSLIYHTLLYPFGVLFDF